MPLAKLPTFSLPTVEAAKKQVATKKWVMWGIVLGGGALAAYFLLRKKKGS